MSPFKISKSTTGMLLISMLVLTLWRTTGTAFAFGITAFSPLGAMALFSGNKIKHSTIALLYPILCIYLSDVFLSRWVFQGEWRFWYSGAEWVYGAFFLMALVGKIMPSLRFNNFIGAALVVTFIHWIVTDLGVWLSPYSSYEKTWDGFVLCLMAAIPFEWKFLIGTLGYGFFLLIVLQLFAGKSSVLTPIEQQTK
jgi:hypothetical protein